MSTNLLFVANWKMYMGVEQSIDFIRNNKNDFVNLSKDYKIVICPSNSSMHPIKQILKEINVYLGAQNCSIFDYGAYTGQESVQTLKELGCKYCIVGHSESRIHLHENDEFIIKKCKKLLSIGISPILCIGETKEEFESGKSLAIIEKQLSGIEFLETSHTQVLVAYEPIWSIGTGNLPLIEYLEKIFSWLKNHLKNKNFSLKLLYGGSVNSTTIPYFKKIPLFGC